MSQIHLRFGLRSRIAAALGLTSVGTAAVLLVGSLWIVSGLIGQADLRELRGHYDAFQSLIEQEARTATAMSSVVASMPPVQQAMARGDRAALMSFFGAGFAGLKADFGVEQFQFHTAPATAFLRVHMPEKFGDDLSGFRKTVVNANASNKTVFGLEGGVAGLGIRGVVPIDLAGEQIGTVEFGLSFGQAFFDQFKRLRGIDIAFHLSDKGVFRTFGGTLGEKTLFTAADYSSAASGELLMREGTLEANPVAALLGPIHDFSGKPIGAVELVMNNADYIASATRADELAIGVACLALLTAAALGWRIARGIARPIIGLTEAMRGLASGDHRVVLPTRRTQDEISRMVQAVEVFRTTAIERSRLESEQDARKREQAEKQSALTEMAEAIERETTTAVGKIDGRTQTMAASAREMSSAATRTEALAEAASTASTEALTTAQTVASAAEQLSASIAEISAQMAQSTEGVGRAVGASGEARNRIAKLNEQMGRIGAVADMIGEIAAKTNLLAVKFKIMSKINLLHLVSCIFTHAIPVILSG